MTHLESYDYHEYTFDSLDASIPYSNTSASTDWPYFKLTNPLSNIAAIKILEVEIPFSFYTLTTEGTFDVSYNGGAYTTLTITPGSYSSTSLQTAVQAQLVTVDASFTVAIDTVRSKFIFTAALPFNFRFPNTMSTDMRIHLGFSGGVSSATFDGASYVLTSSKVFGVTGPDYLFLNSTRLGPLLDIYLPAEDSSSKGGIGPQVAKIPINVNPFEVITWQDPAPNFYFSLKNVFQLKDLDFYLSAGNGVQNILDLNGLGFSIKIGLLVNQDSTQSNSLGVRKIRRVK